MLHEVNAFGGITKYDLLNVQDAFNKCEIPVYNLESVVACLSTRFDLKELHKLIAVRLIDTQIAKIYLEMSESILISKLQFRHNSALIRFTVFNNYDGDSKRCFPFWEEDIFRRYDKGIIIDSIVAVERGDGLAALQNFVKEFNCEVFLEAGYLFRGDYERYYDGDENMRNLPEKLAGIYSKAGFTSVNDQFGCEEGIVMQRKAHDN